VPPFVRDRDEDVAVLYPFIMRQRTLDIRFLVVKMRADKKDETLKKMLDLLMSKDIDVLHMIRGPTDVKAKSVTYIFVLNMRRASITIEALVQELKKMEGIKDVMSKTEKLGDITFFPNAFPLYTYDRAVVLSSDFLKALFNSFYAYFKQPALAASILYQLGMRVGYSLAKEIHEETKHTGEVLIRDVLDLLKSFGIGNFDFKVSRLKHGEYTFRLEKSLEAEVVTIKGPRCHFTRGLLSGIVSFVEGEYVQVQETKCSEGSPSPCIFVTLRKK